MTTTSSPLASWLWWRKEGKSSVAESNHCPICGEGATANPDPTNLSLQQFICSRCGRFEISDDAADDFERASGQARAKLSGWLYEQNQLGEHPRVTTDTIDRVHAAPPIGVQDKANRLLLALVKRTRTYGSDVSLDRPDLIATIHGVNSSEVYYFAFEVLQQRGLIRLSGRSAARVLPDGFARAEELSAAKAASAQCFVAMWFGAGMKAIYDEALDPAIRGAGFEPLRVDLVEHAGKIDDEIIAQIRRSGLMVADFTGHRGGVYFEAGFARGLGIPVFWTCRADDLKDLHFDIRQFNFIDWADASDLRRRLQNRIEAVIGDGPRKPRPS